MQKKSLRIIHKKHYNYHTEPLFKTSQILKVQDQYKLNTATFMHQLKYHKLPSSLSQRDPADRFTLQTNIGLEPNSLHYSHTINYHRYGTCLCHPIAVS